MSTPVTPQEGEARLQRLRETNLASYAVHASAAHNTANWLLATASTANSAGFYFAMSVESSWWATGSATAFLLALGSTFWSGVLVATVHAKDAEQSDALRRAETETVEGLFRAAQSAWDEGNTASAHLDIWTKVAVGLTMIAPSLKNVKRRDFGDVHMAMPSITAADA
ncbi:MAG: hypothetical protein ABI668_12120 [Sphingorhabdus sp.]